MTPSHHGKDAPPEGATLLWAAKPWIIKNYGAVCEGDVFSVLAGLDCVVRSFEFARVDGALCLDELDHAPGASYAERFLAAREHAFRNPRSRRFMQFDVKSSTGLEAGTQHLVTRLTQHRRVAFYVGMCASNPGFVSLIPNLRVSRRRSEEHQFIVSSTRTLAVPGGAYGYLDPEEAAHRMPIGLLPLAVERVRACAVAGEDYVNPWTGLAYVGWRPLTTETLDDLWPREGTEIYQSCLGMLSLWRGLRLAREDGHPCDVRFDMVGLQPRLADTKIVVRGRQWLVQCKSDARDRRPNYFGDVPIARPLDGRMKLYFSSHDRFDFLLYDLGFRDGSIGFFFLPERVLPDDFFTTSASAASFARDEFTQYYREVKEDADWGRHILDVIERTPMPRRPSRPHHEHAWNLPLARKVADRVEALQRPRAVRPPKLLSATVSHGRLFRGVLDECAQRLSGVVVAFAGNHPACDFGFVPYAWTEAERDAYRASGQPPAMISDLPMHAPVVPLYVIAKDVGCDWKGPILSGADFRRVNSWQPGRLIIFDVAATEDSSLPGPLFVVPTTDLSVTPRHMQEYENHVQVSKKDGDRHGRVPLVRELLHSGCNIVDYVLTRDGPAVYEEAGWGELWTLLDRFAGGAPFVYPRACPRAPEDYRVTLRQLHTRWWEETCSHAQDNSPAQI